MTEAFMRRTLAGLVPNDELAKDAFAKIKLGEVVRCDIKKPRDSRSSQQLRLYWKLCQVVLENTDGQFASREQVSDYLKIQAGHCDQAHIKIPDGDGFQTVLWLQPRSIAFDKMDQAQFQDYWGKALDVVVGRIIPGMGREQLENEIMELVG